MDMHGIGTCPFCGCGVVWEDRLFWERFWRVVCRRCEIVTLFPRKRYVTIKHVRAKWVHLSGTHNPFVQQRDADRMERQLDDLEDEGLARQEREHQRRD